MKFLIPNNLNLEQLILAKDEHLIYRRVTVNGKRIFERIPTKSKTLLKHLPYCYYLIDLIIKRSSIDDRNKAYGYVNLRTELLDMVIPHVTRIMVSSLLLELNVIDINTSYNVNEYSKSYRISSLYDISILSSIEYNIDTKKGYYIGIQSNEINRGKQVSKSLCSILFAKSNSIQQKAIKQKELKTNDLLSLPEYQYQQKNIFNLNLNIELIEREGKKQELLPLLEKVSTGDLSINVNNSVNRVFSPLTNLRKEYRKYVVDNTGDSLLEIDFRSSHIFHLLRMIVDSSTSIELLEEVNKLKEIALKDMYEYVAMQSKKVGYAFDRTQAKQLFIESFLYGMYPNRKKSIWVKSLFPKISAVIQEKNRRDFSIQLQKSESHLLNNRIFKRIAAELPECISYGIFDSILCEEKYIRKVYSIMMEESKLYFGYEVPIEIKGEILKPVLTEAIKEQVSITKVPVFDYSQYIDFDFDTFCTSTDQYFDDYTLQCRAWSMVQKMRKEKLLKQNINN